MKPRLNVILSTVFSTTSLGHDLFVVCTDIIIQ